MYFSTLLQNFLAFKLFLTPWAQLLVVIAALPLYFSRSVQVQSVDTVYESLLRWINGRCPNTRHQNARLSSRGLIYELSPDHWNLVWYQGWPYLCQRCTRYLANTSVDTVRIWTIGRSQQSLHELIEAVYQEPQAHQEYVRVYLTKFQYGVFVWKEARSQSYRSIESVDMDPLTKAKVVDDFQKFLSCRERYARCHQPYRRGYLFYGPPGTGKTSLAVALASASQGIRMDIYVLSINHRQMSDQALLELFTELPPNALVLLEDVDVLGISDDQKQQGATLSALLAALDGPFSSSGRVVIMSTNKIDAMDPRMLRPGRVDMQVEFFLATPTTAQAMFNRWYANDVPAEDLEKLGKKFASSMPDQSTRVW